jgi:hypothetical protein
MEQTYLLRPLLGGPLSSKLEDEVWTVGPCWLASLKIAESRDHVVSKAEEMLGFSLVSGLRIRSFSEPDERKVGIGKGWGRLFKN